MNSTVVLVCGCQVVAVDGKNMWFCTVPLEIFVVDFDQTL
jgi:hypothetical protein